MGDYRPRQRGHWRVPGRLYPQTKQSADRASGRYLETPDAELDFSRLVGGQRRIIRFVDRVSQKLGVNVRYAFDGNIADSPQSA